MKITLLFFLLGSAAAFTKETDQFLIMDQEFADSTQGLDQIILKSFRATLKNAGGFKNTECPKVVDELMAPLRQYEWPSRTERIERLASNAYCTPNTPELCFDISFKNISDVDYWLKTIYADLSRFRLVTPAKTTNINGYYVGLDKIGHFFNQGSTYYQEFLRGLKLSPFYNKVIQNEHKDFEARFKLLAVPSIKIGIGQESGILGLTASKVFSYGDLEANYQGMMMMVELCHAQGSPLQKDLSGQFSISDKFSLKTYFNPHMDETYQASFYNHEGNDWKLLQARIQNNCPKAKSNVYQKRLAHYAAWDKAQENADFWPKLRGFSRRYLAEQALAKKIPDHAPFKLNKLCEL